jgi:hypothetical protein
MDLPASLRSICSSCSSGMAETFSSWIRFITFPRRTWFFELATFSLSFWSSVQAKRARVYLFSFSFFLFPFGAQTDTEINPLY